MKLLRFRFFGTLKKSST